MDMKTDLRIKAKSIRKNLNILEISENLTGKIRQNPYYIKAQNVMLFYPTKYEIDLRELLSDCKNFYFPRVDGDRLLVCPYSDGDKLEKSTFNIYEPCSAAKPSSVLDLVIVPALMADKDGYRLGYGGGFYDRFLKTLDKNKVKTICALPKELVIDDLVHEDFDVPVDFVVVV